MRSANNPGTDKDVMTTTSIGGAVRIGGVRIGAVNYLNSKPLIEGLHELLPEAELSLDYPSRLAEDLEAGQLDVALVPSIEVLRHADYEIVSDACVATRGPVMSVKLYSRVPFGEIQSLALDAGSRTSAALARIMLQERFGVRPRLEPFALRAVARLDSDRCRAADRRPGHARAGRAFCRHLGPRAKNGCVGPACRSCSPCGRPRVTRNWRPSRRRWAGRATWESNGRPKSPSVKHPTWKSPRRPRTTT